jgi:hypothetical protein
VKTTGISDSHEPGLGVNFLAALSELDHQVAAQVQRAGCPHCGGRLDRADYGRKPRGGGLAPEVETWTKRLSLCCAREGCRRRATPPSVRFLGRKVYAEVVVLLACIRAASLERAAAEAATGVPARTVRRWLGWWQTVFVASAFWIDSRARLVPPVEECRLPESLLERFPVASALLDVARFIGSITTRTVPDGSRYLRFVM